MQDLVTFSHFKFENQKRNFSFCFLKSPTYPICHIFISKKSVDKSGFVDKSGCDKSEDALYFNIFKKFARNLPRKKKVDQIF